MTEALTPESFVELVDHTLLKPEATREQVEQLAAEGRDLGAASVCVNGLWVPTVADILAGTPVLTCAVVGFPLGAMSRDAVAREAEDVVAAGAEEIDMVIPVGLLRSGDADDLADAQAYVAAVRAVTGEQVLKVILETALLGEDEIRTACRLSVDAGADFVKTSTGFNPAGGATVAAVRVMRETVGPDIGVKASGGIRSLADVEAMLEAGASRLGMSAATAVLEELRAR